MVLPKMKNVYDCNSNDVRVLGNILNCIEKVLDRLDKQQIIDEVLPLIWDFKTYDSEMIIKVIRKHFLKNSTHQDCPTLTIYFYLL